MEALVAVALLAAVLWPFYSLVENLHRSAVLLELSAEHPRIERTALRAIELQPQSDTGSLQIEGWTIVWTSQPSGDPEFAGGSYGMDIHLVWIDAIALTISRDGYSRTTHHKMLSYQRQYQSLDDIMRQ
jgi:hypothetical protein